MKAPRGLRKSVRLAAGEAPGQSALYRYMKKHHRDLAATAGGDGRMNWTVLCPEFKRLGLTDGEGKPPSTGRAAGTWRRVCADVERAAASRAARPPAKRPPSRLPDGWRPPEASRPGAPAPPPQQPAPTRPQPVPTFPWTSGPATAAPSVPGARSPPVGDTEGVPADPADRKAIARAKLARIKARFAHEDRFLHPPKKRDIP